MADKIKLAIVTPDAEALAIECDEVVAPGVNGEIGLLAGHVPLITALRPGVLSVVTGNKKQHYAVSTGFAEIEADTVTILTDSCEAAESVDVDRAKRALLDAEAKLSDLSAEQQGYAATRDRLARARARIDAAARRA